MTIIKICAGLDPSRWLPFPTCTRAFERALVLQDIREYWRNNPDFSYMALKEYNKQNFHHCGLSALSPITV